MNGLTAEARNALVDWLFNTQYQTLIAPKYYDAVDTQHSYGQRTEHIREDGAVGVIHTVSGGNEALIMDSMLNRTRYTGDSDADAKIADTPVDKTITPARMADVLHAGGVFQLIDVRDATIIHDKTDTYLAGLKAQAELEPFYPLPPEEDLNKLINLAAKLDPLAYIVNESNIGNGIWADLMQQLDIKGTYVVGRKHNDLSIAHMPADIAPVEDPDFMTGSVSVGNTFNKPSVLGDPYKF